ncbi:MAG TPA: hypothetical protein VMF67_06060 [Rhizomicrobium sp.]|nr:hypothetical protein [Rhizomicrobium sp.]
MAAMLKISTIAIALALLPSCSAAAPGYDIVIHGGTIYDGSGGKPYVGDIAITGDRIARIAPQIEERGRAEIDAKGKVVAPGFINMLAHPEESLFADGRGLSDLAQGVTYDIGRSRQRRISSRTRSYS